MLVNISAKFRYIYIYIYIYIYVYTIKYFRRQDPTDDMTQLRKSVDNQHLVTPISKSSNKPRKKGKVGNPIFGNIDPVQLFETLVKNKVLKGIISRILIQH